MKKLSTLLLVLLAIAIPALTWLPGYGNASTKKETIEKQVENVSSFEQAVQIIKKYEGLHSSKHWPFVGYGHRVLPGEKYSRSTKLSEKEAEALLRKDLLKNCAVFREYGKDSLLLGVLAYNIGPGAALKSSVAKKLKNGDRNIRENYLAHSKYRGKTLSGLKKRRVEEFEALFINEVKPEDGIIEIDTLEEAGKGSMAYASMESDDNSLFSSVLSPIRLMMSALSNPFRLATWGLSESKDLLQTYNQPVSNLLCATSI
ncbi:MAG: lysozyme [Bacteroidales bacterium]|nr:lysozyme [Bacteroidales bacterium]